MVCGIMRPRVLVDHAIAGTPAFVHECVELLACGFPEGLNERPRKGDGRPTDSGFSALIAGDTGVHNLPRSSRPSTDHDMVCAWMDNVKRANVVARRNFPVARYDT